MIVLTTCVDIFILTQFESKGNLAFIRLVRLLRLTRALRLIRILKSFAPLRVLVSTVMRSLMALFWSMVLLSLMIFIASVFLCQSLQPYMSNEIGAMSASDRRELFNLYGSS